MKWYYLFMCTSALVVLLIMTAFFYLFMQYEYNAPLVLSNRVLEQSSQKVFVDNRCNLNIFTEKGKLKFCRQ